MTPAPWITLLATVVLSSFAGSAQNVGKLWWPQFLGGAIERAREFWERRPLQDTSAEELTRQMRIGPGVYIDDILGEARIVLTTESPFSRYGALYYGLACVVVSDVLAELSRTKGSEFNSFRTEVSDVIQSHNRRNLGRAYTLVFDVVRALETAICVPAQIRCPLGRLCRRENGLR